MAKRRFGIIVLLLSFCLCILPCQGLAASTADAKEPISVEKECSLTISYGYEGAVFSDQAVKLYKVADVSADFQYALASAFAASGLILNGVQTQDEWNGIRSTLEAQILADKLAPIQTAQTNGSGEACFTQLTPGLYLASAVEVTQEGLTCFFDSALVTLPGLGADGLWQYSLAVAAKPQVLPPPQPEEEMKVLKLWKGDAAGAGRPKSVEVEIFRNGTSYETVTLSEENNWSYSWSGKDGGHWKVIERNVPSGYVMTVQQRNTTFVITNTRQAQSESDPPKTGDTRNPLVVATVMFASGAMLVILGISGKRKRHE